MLFVLLGQVSFLLPRSQNDKKEMIKEVRTTADVVPPTRKSVENSLRK
jgi:hypothetical protein